jgi:hypothetical protein
MPKLSARMDARFECVHDRGLKLTMPMKPVLAPGVGALSPADPVLRGLGAGTAGLLRLAGCLMLRFRQRRSAPAAARAAGYFPLAAVIFFGAGTIAQILLMISGTHVGGLPVLATRALAIGYGVRAARREHARLAPD